MLRSSPGWNTAAKTIISLLLASSAFAVTLEELRSVPDLTPQKFASFFSKFEFKFRPQVQSPEVFLATESGDCDDYSTLAAMVLKERGYTPRLISIRMPKITHVVCYIEEAGCYLDYDARGYLVRTISCGSEIADIATKVAKSSRTSWTSASEFTYESGVKRLVKTVVDKPQGKFAALVGK